MQSAQTQILSLLADQRIEVADAERLLAIVCSRDRFLALLLGFAIAAVIATASVFHSHLGDPFYACLHSALQPITESEAFRNLHIFAVRILGELP